LTGNLPNVLLSGLFRSATEPNNKTFDRRFALIIVAAAAIISAKAPVNAALCVQVTHLNKSTAFKKNS
jgi:predicted component of type VI protein secretion system